MPSNESLQQFNDSLIETGNEPAIAAERGEQIEAVSPPQPGEFETGSPADSAQAAAEDFFSTLSETLEQEEISEDVDGLAPPAEDFLSDLGLGDEEPQLTDFGLDEPADEFNLGGIGDEFGGSEEEFGGTGEEFGGSEEEFGGIGDDFGADEAFPPDEAVAEPEPEPEAGSDAAGGDLDFEDLGDAEIFSDDAPAADDDGFLEEGGEDDLSGVDFTEAEEEEFGGDDFGGEEFGADELADEFDETEAAPEEGEPEDFAGGEIAEDVFGGDFGLDEDAGGDGALEGDFGADFGDDFGEASVSDGADADDLGFDDFTGGEEFAEMADFDEAGGLSAEDAGIEDFDEAGDFEAVDDFAVTDEFGEGEDLGAADEFGGPEDFAADDEFGSVEDFGFEPETGGDEGADAAGAAPDLDSDFPGTDDFDQGLEFSDESDDSDFGDFDAGGVEDLGSDSFGSDDFDSAGFDADDGAEAMEDLGSFDDGFDSSDFGDEFSMGDFGAEFGIMEDEGPEAFEAEEPVSPEAEAMVGEALEEAAAHDESADYAISENQFGDLKKTLSYLPLNLKIAVADVVAGGQYDFEQVVPLIEALYDQQSPRYIAKLVSRITGKKIEIPRGYEKRTGVSFEQERKSFAYQFRETVWPVLRLVMAGTALLAAMLFLGYRYIYQPLFARNLYEQGLENIRVQEYQQANRLFDQAYEIWPVNPRFLEYAEAFADERQYALAREKYETLLSDDIDPLNREGILQYADFALYDLRDYGTTLEYLQRLLNEDPFDYEPRILKGDAYLEWGRITVDPELQAQYFEQARYDYASLIDRNGQTDELLFRMLRYFIATRNIEDALNLKDLFLNDPRAVLDPRGMTELAGFLLDLSEDGISGVGGADSEELVNQYVASLRGDNSGQNLLEDAIAVINRAMELDDNIPELHYYRARYDRLTDDLRDEIIALRNARELYDELGAQRPLDRFETAREIDTHIREAEYLYRLEEILSAEARLGDAVRLYEQALAARKVDPQPRFGRAYALLGDIYYYEASDYDEAYQKYAQARANGYGSLTAYPELFAERQDIAYKMGFIELFRANEFEVQITDGAVELAEQQDLSRRQMLLDRAITEFNQAQGAVPTANINLLYARANTQYMRENYYDAASLYRILLDELTGERRSISTFLLEEDERHRALIDFQIRVNNNLGVTLYRLYQQGGENAEDLLAQSQLFLSRSTELAENLVRDAETAVRADTRPLAYLNLTNILAPGFEDAVQIDPDIRKDLAAPTF
jgi:hypothetical protein